MSDCRHYVTAGGLCGYWVCAEGIVKGTGIVATCGYRSVCDVVAFAYVVNSGDIAQDTSKFAAV